MSTKQVVRVNCNETVAVTLSEFGARTLNNYWARLYEHFPVGMEPRKVYAAGERLETQLWDLMNIFGPVMKMGFEVPFKPLEIEFSV